MYIRLWWKDARQFWPIWAFLVVVAGVSQLAMDRLAGPETRGEALLPMAMGLACLYAYAAGAAAFAGEREAGTLRLLDVLPAPRGVVWAGKVSFAVATTTTLALVLVAMALLDATPRPGDFWRLPDGVATLRLSTLIAESLALGMLCSALLPSALTAAVAAIVLTGICRIVTLRIAEVTLRDPTPWDIGLTLAAVAASWVAFLGGLGERRLPFALRFRSPVEVAWADAPAAVADRPRVPVAAPSRGIAAGASTPVARPRPRSRSVELRHLFWQAIREGRSTWLFLVPIALLCGIPMFFRVPVDPFFLVPWNILIALTAGVSVFGLENRHRTHRFAAQHGARPGLVWTAKLSAWCLGLAILWGPQLYLFSYQTPRLILQESAFRSFLVVPLFFAVAVLCGMAIPRGITAAVVAMVAGILLGMFEGILHAVGMLPTWGMIVLPSIFLATSWGWSGDWLLDRAAPGRWVRLASTLAGLLTIAFAGYTADRAWGIADVGPIAPPAAWAAATSPIPDDRNAAPLYREATNKLQHAFYRPGNEIEMPDAVKLDTVIGKQTALDLDRPQGREVVDLIRRALARPECRFVDAGWLTMRSRDGVPPLIRQLGDALAARAARRTEKGDLAGAWDDILTDLRMTRQIGQGPILIQQLTAIHMELKGLRVARHWANADGQSADRLRAAMAAYRGLPEMTPPSDVVRGEGLTIERTLDLPVDELRDLLLEIEGERRREVSIAEALALDALSTPWEIARTRRINRGLTAEASRQAALEHWQRPPGRSRFELEMRRSREGGASLLWLFQPAYQAFVWNEDVHEAERRGLLYVMAIREWMFRHDGRFPHRLEELVPDILPSLPLDPYTGRPFGYLTLVLAKRLHQAEDWSKHPWPEGSRLVYSVGQDGVDNHGLPAKNNYSAGGDLVFPIFPAPAEKKGK